MIEVQDLESEKVKPVLKKLIIETLTELSQEVSPPDRVALLLYQFFGDFRQFKLEVYEKFNTMEKRFDESDQRFIAMDKRFDAVDKRFDKMVEKEEFHQAIDKMVTKEELRQSMKELVSMIGISVKKLLDEDRQKRLEPTEKPEESS